MPILPEDSKELLNPVPAHLSGAPPGTMGYTVATLWEAVLALQIRVGVTPEPEQLHTGEEAGAGPLENQTVDGGAAPETRPEASARQLNPLDRAPGTLPINAEVAGVPIPPGIDNQGNPVPTDPETGVLESQEAAREAADVDSQGNTDGEIEVETIEQGARPGGEIDQEQARQRDVGVAADADVIDARVVDIAERLETATAEEIDAIERAENEQDEPRKGVQQAVERARRRLEAEAGN